jgi:hypothetical protein
MQFSLRTLILAMTVLAVCAALLGRMTMNGTVIVSNQNAAEVERVLGACGFPNYNRHGAQLDFPKPLSLHYVDDAIMHDAQKKGYCVEIHYNALFPQFSSKIIVNPEIGL